MAEISVALRGWSPPCLRRSLNTWRQGQDASFSADHLRGLGPWSLSKGYRQRVGIAQALVGNPKVIIFDEPTVGLDPKQIIEIRNLIKELGKNHTVILSTHILPEVQAVCDRIIIINKGKIVANERTDEISKAFEGGKRLTVKVCGNKNDSMNAIKSIEGVRYVESLGNHDADSYSFLVECEPGVDVRKSISKNLAQKGLVIIGMETLGSNLEDIFLMAVEDKEPVKKKRRRNRADGAQKED